MATLLYRIGRFAFRRRVLTLLLWILVLVGAAVAASSAPAPPADTFSMPGTQSQQALDLLKQRFPTLNPDGASARVVVRAPAHRKISDPAERRKVAALVADLAKGPQVVGATDPYTTGAVSKDGTTAYTIATYDVVATKVSDRAHDALTKAADRARASGLRVEMGGDAVPVEQAAGGSAEAVGIVLAAVILLVTFGSLIAAGMPLLTAVMGVGIGVSAIGALGSTLGLSSTTTTLALMIGLAVGIDYALFIISRYRAEMADGRERSDAAGRAVGAAGSAVVFAGLTVIVALAGLAVVHVPILTKMGLAAAGTVAIAVLVAVTLVPALLGFAPIRVLRRRDRKVIAGRPLSERQARKAAERAARQRPNLSARWAGLVLRRPVVVLMFAVLGLGVVAIPAARLQLGLPGEGTMAPDTTQRKAYDMLSDSFGPGFNGPLLITVEARDAKSAARAVEANLSRQPGVALVGSPTVNKAGDTAVLTVVPDQGPADGRTKQLVNHLRGDLAGVGRDRHAEVLVSGQTAMFIDFSRTLTDALLPYLAIVVGLAFLTRAMWWYQPWNERPSKSSSPKSCSMESIASAVPACSSATEATSGREWWARLVSHSGFGARDGPSSVNSR